MPGISRVLLAAILVSVGACQGGAGPQGPEGPPGTNGSNGQAGPAGDAGASVSAKGTIAGTVKDSQSKPLAGASITTVPPSTTATTDASGAFTLSSIAIGSYGVVAADSGYASYTLPNVGVAAGATTNVSLTLTVSSSAPATISGKVTDSQAAPSPVAGATVSVEGQSVSATTDANGAYTLSGVAPGPVFVSVTPPSGAMFLPGETRNAVVANPASTVTGVDVVLSARPSDNAVYIGMGTLCSTCHGPNNHTTGNIVGALQSAAHNRSLTRIARDANGAAVAGAWTRLLNPTIKTPRTVMIPLQGTIAVPAGAVVTGTGTAFATGPAGVALQPGDTLGYMPKGLGWYTIGVVKSVDSDTQLTLAGNAAFAPGVTSLAAGTKYGVTRLSSTGHTHMWPEDATDIVAPAWPGVKATNPNYDPNDPQIYASSGAYPDGQVNVYLCNLKGSTVQGVTYANDEYVQKFGGNPYTCSDGTFWDGTTTPAVPMVHIDVVYGGQGDKDGNGAPHPNVGVFKQRYQGRLADVKAAASWTYTTPPSGMIGGKAYDSLTLPIQVLESGDRVNGGFKMNGYHPTEQKFPGESWSQRQRTFSHACAGCHTTGLSIAWTDPSTTTVNLPFPRDDGKSTMNEAFITTYNFYDENLTCEHCHGPASEHIGSGGGRGHAIINPKYMTAESERQMCGKCHAFDDAVNASPAQTYGFEYAWNTDWANKVGGGNYVAGIYDLAAGFANFDERTTDDEALWDPSRTGGKLYGQAHRQQYTMLSYAVHTNNPYVKVTCTSCHDAHSTYLGTTHVEQQAAGADAGAADTYDFQGASYKNNTLCLSCHAGGGPLATMSGGPFAGLTKDDVAALQFSVGGAVAKNGQAMTAPSADDINAAISKVASAVSAHMLDKAKMGNVVYDPTNDALPTGRCSSCHMPKVAKSGGYWTGPDYLGNESVVEGDQASHVFDVIWPAQAMALSRGGPTFQSGYYAQAFSATNVKYDKFGYMPNSCSKCHTGSRKASLFCPDTTAVWPSYWPLNDATADPNMSYLSNCFVSTAAP